MRYFLILIALLCLLSCSNRKKEFNDILKPSNVSSQYFTINPTEDTTITTSHAGIYTITKGTFATTEKIVIEIKEIFTPAEILLSGLTTLSDGKPLASAGMLYFNATVNGKKIEPSLPIKTFIPGKNPTINMKLFTGEIQSDSTINWVDPKEMGRDTTKTVSEANVTKVPDTSKKGCLDTIYLQKVNTFPEYNTNRNIGGFLADTIRMPFENSRKEGYNFEVTANGWYNIDAFLKDEAGIENVKLSVEVKTEEDFYLNMYLFIPTERVMIAASSKMGKQYLFSYNEDKTIPLPLQHRAIVLGFSSSGKRIMYGATEFNIEKEQVLPMELKEISKKALIYLIASKNLNGIEIEAIEKEMLIVPCGKKEVE